MPAAERNVASTCNSFEPHSRQWIKSGSADKVSKSSPTDSIGLALEETDVSLLLIGILKTLRGGRTAVCLQ